MSVLRAKLSRRGAAQIALIIISNQWTSCIFQLGTGIVSVLPTGQMSRVELRSGRENAHRHVPRDPLLLDVPT